MIKGIVSAVPKNIITNTDEKFVKATGVRERRQADLFGTGTLGIAAADRLLEALHIDTKSIGAVIFVTQTSPVRMPALSAKLCEGIGYSGPAFDVNLACSGYPYGLWLASAIGERTVFIVQAKRTDCGRAISLPRLRERTGVSPRGTSAHPYHGLPRVSPTFRRLD